MQVSSITAGQPAILTQVGRQSTDKVSQIAPLDMLISLGQQASAPKQKAISSCLPSWIVNSFIWVWEKVKEAFEAIRSIVCFWRSPLLSTQTQTEPLEHVKNSLKNALKLFTPVNLSPANKEAFSSLWQHYFDIAFPPAAKKMLFIEDISQLVQQTVLTENPSLKEDEASFRAACRRHAEDNLAKYKAESLKFIRDLEPVHVEGYRFQGTYIRPYTLDPKKELPVLIQRVLDQVTEETKEEKASPSLNGSSPSQPTKKPSF